MDKYYIQSLSRVEKSIGLTWDGQYLWTDDFEEDLLYQISPEDGSVIYTVPSPHPNPRDLAWDGEYLWVLGGNTLYQVDVGNTTSVDEITDQKFPRISGFPNPFYDFITIKYCNGTTLQIFPSSISNLSGKLLKVLENDFKSCWRLRNSMGWKC